MSRRASEVGWHADASSCTVVVTRQGTDYVWRKNCDDIALTLVVALADYKANAKGACRPEAGIHDRQLCGSPPIARQHSHLFPGLAWNLQRAAYRTRRSSHRMTADPTINCAKASTDCFVSPALSSWRTPSPPGA